MSRLAASFARLAAARRKALIPYVTAGHPGREISVPLMHAMVAAGADAIELGVPFSDPMADGPVIQRANEAALARGIGLRSVLEMVREFRNGDATTPVVLMGYANPIERMGVEPFLDAAREAGVDGLIVVDYPPEESEAFAASARAHGIDLVFLLAPTSGDERIEHVARLASGYVYYVSLKGITGAGHLDTAEVAQRVHVPVGRLHVSSGPEVRHRPLGESAHQHGGLNGLHVAVEPVSAAGKHQPAAAGTPFEDVDLRHEITSAS